MKKPKKRKMPKSRSPIAASLADPAFRKRVVKSKKFYDRNNQKGQDDGDDV